MSAEVVVIVEAFTEYLRSLGLKVYLGPSQIDPPDVGLRLYYVGAAAQGADRERISLEAILTGRGMDPGLYLGKIMSHSRILASLLQKGFEYPLSASLKAKAELKPTSEGRFIKEEAEDKYDWIFQAYYRVELSYNPVVLDDPELSG